MKRIFLSLVFLACMTVPLFATVPAVPSTALKNHYTTDGVGTTFSYTFPINSSADIQLWVTDLSGVLTQITTGFSVNTTTQKITYPTNGTILPAGETVTLVRSVPISQTSTLSTQGPFPAVTLNTALDKQAMIAQQLQAQIDRTVKLPITSDSAPYISSPQTGYALVWQADGNIGNSLLVGATGPQGPAGPAGSGSGDVLGPPANTINDIPQWSGPNNKTLKNGVSIGTAAYNIIQLTAASKLPAVDGSLLTNVSIGTASVSGAKLTSLGSISAGAGSIPSANITALPDSSLAQITTAGKVSGAALTSLDTIPYGSVIPLGNLPSILPTFKMGTFTRDLTTASGDVAYTGVGFTPRLILFWGAVNGQVPATYFGSDDGTNHYCERNAAGEGAGTVAIDGTSSISLAPSGGNAQAAFVKTLGADGFTLTWTKAGAPTGTATIFYIAWK